jgi:excisionase family DNA binding protein
MTKPLKLDLPLSQRLLAPVKEVAKMINRSEPTVYRMCRSGRFRTVMVGDTMMVVLSSILEGPKAA